MFTLPDLPYATDALDPHIDKLTMEIHHGKHHAGYVNNLNNALKDHKSLLELDVEKLLGNIDKASEEIRQAVINNGGGHANHSLFWKTMSPKGGGKPTGTLAKRIKKDFGGYEKFQEIFEKTAMTRFGSGWAWLVDSNNKLEVVSTANQDSPISDNQHPLLGLDVWEHAYYLNYQNRRADYVKAFWNVVNWGEVAKRL